MIFDRPSTVWLIFQDSFARRIRAKKEKKKEISTPREINPATIFSLLGQNFLDRNEISQSARFSPRESR